jgi:hypothetical protein
MMEETLAGAGILCIAAALLTRQLKAAGRNVPQLVRSTQRQALLAGMGGVLLAGALLSHLVDPSAMDGDPLRGNITPPHATDAPPSASDSAQDMAPQMAGQGASSEGPGGVDDTPLDRADRPETSAQNEDELRSRSRDRKRGPSAGGPNP